MYIYNIIIWIQKFQFKIHLNIYFEFEWMIRRQNKTIKRKNYINELWNQQKSKTNKQNQNKTSNKTGDCHHKITRLLKLKTIKKSKPI